MRRYFGCLIKGVGIVFGLIIIILLGIYLLITYEHTLVKSQSPDKKWTIIVKYEEAISFGHQWIHVYYKKSNEIFSHELFETDLANDGKSLDEDNYKIIWEKDKVTLILSGEEQKDDVHKIDLTKLEK